MWWHMPLILGLRRQRRTDFCAFKVSLVYNTEFQNIWNITVRHCLGEGNAVENKGIGLFSLGLERWLRG